MKTRIIIAVIAVVMVVGSFFGLRSLTEEVSSQGVAPNHDLQTSSGRLKILRDKDLRTKNWELLVQAIEKEATNFTGRSGQSDLEIPSNEMIAAMIDLLDWERPRPSERVVTGVDGVKIDVLMDSAPNRTASYPAVWTLVAWKDLAIPAVIEVLETNDPKSVKWNSAFTVVRQKFEFDGIQTSNFLTVEAAASSTETGKQRLLAASRRALQLQKELDDARVRDSQGVVPPAPGEVRKVDIEPKATP